MGLTTGSRVGPYEILSPIGAGGMGEVYRARDRKLNRDVALKVIPDSFALDPTGQYMVIQLNESDSVRLVRVPLNGGPEQMLNFPGVRLAEAPIAANAIRSDGVILKSLAVSSWYWAAGLLHPDTGKVDRITLPSPLDVHYPIWGPDGRILLFGFLDEGTLWRFKLKN